MTIARIAIVGVVSGLIMGVALFLTGAVAAYFFYGEQMAPEGKFDEEQMNPWYFIWTKLAIGVVFGLIFTAIYSRLPISRRGGVLRGLLFGFALWLVITLWNLSHPPRLRTARPGRQALLVGLHARRLPRLRPRRRPLLQEAGWFAINCRPGLRRGRILHGSV